MEGEHISLDVVAERLRSFDSRIRSNHDSVAKLRESDTKRREQQARIEAQLADQSKDLEDLKILMNKILWGLFGAIAVGLMFVVAVASLVVQSV